MISTTAIVPSAQPSDRSERAVRREFEQLLDEGATLVCAGDAREAPRMLLEKGHRPKSKITLFGTAFYLTHPRQNPDLRFFVAYIVPPTKDSRPPIYCRIFYKDISLIWRVATHLFLDGDEMWVGKGDTTTVVRGGWEYEESNESTTDLPLEMQSAMERLNHTKLVRQSSAVLPLVLRRAPRDRIRAYEDFTAPREAAASDRQQVHRGRRVVWFQRPDDPSSLRIAKGFEPDFSAGALEVSSHHSKFYGGDVERHRILSVNRKIQHFFFHAPQHAWMIPPQALTTQLSSYGVRTVDVIVDEDAYVPGYEYHYYDDDAAGNPQLHSQIPSGFAGDPSPLDDTRVDASAWLEQIPVLQAFRKYRQRHRANSNS